MIDLIKNKLSILEPTLLEVKDDSGRHKGHKGIEKAENTHFTLTIVSNKFVDKTKIARHKIIYNLLQAEFSNGLHALSIRAFTYDEYFK